MMAARSELPFGGCKDYCLKAAGGRRGQAIALLGESAPPPTAGDDDDRRLPDH